MDWVLLGFAVLFFVRGFFRGFVSMLFSLLGVVVAIFVAWQLVPIVQPLSQNWIGSSLQRTLEKMLDGAVAGQFSSIAQLQVAVSQSKYALLFNVLLFKVLGNLSIDGSMTAGQILAPTLCALVVKLVTFSLLFVGIYVLLKFVFVFINHFVKKCGLGTGNRILGGAVGLIKGLAMFGVFYFVLTSLANLLLNEALLRFVQSGNISNWLYNTLIVKFLDLIY